MKTIKEPRLSTREAAELLGVCKQRVNAKLVKGDFSGASRCECGRTDMIPISEIHKYMRQHNKRKATRIL
jgi:hypothetical protein